MRITQRGYCNKTAESSRAFIINYRATRNVGCEPKLTLTCLSACQVKKNSEGEACRLHMLSKICAVEFSSPDMTHCHLVVITSCAPIVVGALIIGGISPHVSHIWKRFISGQCHLSVKSDSTQDFIEKERFLLCELATTKTQMNGMLFQYSQYTVNMF